MPSAHRIVINTAPILAIVAALGDLSVFQLYQEVLVPFELLNANQQLGNADQSNLIVVNEELGESSEIKLSLNQM